MRRLLAAVAASVLTFTLIDSAPASAGSATDTYANFRDLAAHETEGKDYRRVQRFPKRARVAHIAIHGGGIEAPTTQLADQAAARKRAFYAFEGIKTSGNSDLHITATRFDEPRALKLVAAVDYTVSWHGAAGADPTTYVGGRDTVLVKNVTAELRAAGFTVATSVPKKIGGTSKRDIANKNRRGMGVQLEISRGQREKFFADGNLSLARIEDPANRTRAFYRYVAAVNRALAKTMARH